MATKRYRRDLKEMERRRRKGMRMLARGVAQAGGGANAGSQSADGVELGQEVAVDPQAWRRKPLGRPGGLDAAQKRQLGKALLAGAVANDFPTELWTLARVAQ